MCWGGYYSLPPGLSVSLGKMKTPPVVVWWCRWSDPAMLALCVFGLRWEAHSLENTHMHEHTVFNLTSPVSSCTIRLFDRVSTNARNILCYDSVKFLPLLQPHGQSLNEVRLQ